MVKSSISAGKEFHTSTTSSQNNDFPTSLLQLRLKNLSLFITEISYTMHSATHNEFVVY